MKEPKRISVVGLPRRCDGTNHLASPIGAQQVFGLLAALLATGYLRLLAHQATALGSAPALKNPSKPLDSRGPKSVNGTENSGELDA